MSERKFVAATLDRFVEVVDDIEGVHLRELPPLTTVLVRTMNSVYRVWVIDGPEVYIQGGLFPELTPAHVDGASVGGSCLLVGWIGVGLLMEIHSGDRRVTTSPVLAIATELLSSVVN